MQSIESQNARPCGAPTAVAASTSTQGPRSTTRDVASVEGPVPVSQSGSGVGRGVIDRPVPVSQSGSGVGRYVIDEFDLEMGTLPVRRT
jgi:hypothetical protein